MLTQNMDLGRQSACTVFEATLHKEDIGKEW